MTQLNLALIGAGNIGEIYVEAIEQVPQAQVVVVCNRTESSGRLLAERAGADWVADYRDAVERADVDAVVVATPSGTHAEIGIAAARAGKHLLVEKPLDITLARIDALLRAVEQADVVLACVFPMRFTRGVHAVKAAVDAGRLGRVTLANAHVKWFRPQSYYEGTWRGTWSLDGGGALMNQSIHTIDLLQWLAGPVESISGRVATLAHQIEAEDTACAILTFRSGALGVVQGATSSWPGDPARVELHGDRGTVALEEGRIVRWSLRDALSGEEEEMLALEAGDGSGAADPTAIGHEKHRRQIVDFAEAILHDRPPAIPGAEARRAVEIIRAIYRSSETKSPVSLPLSDDR